MFLKPKSLKAQFAPKWGQARKFRISICSVIRPSLSVSARLLIINCWIVSVRISFWGPNRAKSQRIYQEEVTLKYPACHIAAIVLFLAARSTIRSINHILHQWELLTNRATQLAARWNFQTVFHLRKTLLLLNPMLKVIQQANLWNTNVKDKNRSTK